MAEADSEELADGVELDEGEIDRLIDTLASAAEAARQTWREMCANHDRTITYEGQGFEVGGIEELAALLLEAEQAAEAADDLVDKAKMAFYDRQPDEPAGEDDD
jgi:hypothetical protein